MNEPITLVEFVIESNRIEGIEGLSALQMIAHQDIVNMEVLTVPALEEFVETVQRGAVLRREPWQNVRVGPHVPPQGGPHIEAALADLLHRAEESTDPYAIHVEYETLHPFTDGNGRSGRAVWLWQMLHLGLDPYALPFLHRWYYQSLQGARP